VSAVKAEATVLLLIEVRLAGPRLLCCSFGVHGSTALGHLSGFCRHCRRLMIGSGGKRLVPDPKCFSGHRPASGFTAVCTSGFSPALPA